MDDMIAVAVKDNDPRFRGYLPFIPASSSVRMSTLVVLDDRDAKIPGFVQSFTPRIFWKSQSRDFLIPG